MLPDGRLILHQQYGWRSGGPGGGLAMQRYLSRFTSRFER